MIAHGFEKYGSKVDAAKWFKRMEDGEEEALKNWRVWRELSVKKYEEEYQRLNVKFDVYLGESMVGKEWQDKALERLETLGLISDVKGEEKKLVSNVDNGYH
jgi:arginyl-tRNA synthetase